MTATPPAAQHVDTPAVSEKDAAIADANLEFQKAVQAASDKRNAVLAKYPDTSLVGITAAAWNATKDVGDPEFAGCILSHREKLLTHAEAVQRLGVTGENPTDFERKCAELFEAAKPKAKAAPAKK